MDRRAVRRLERRLGAAKVAPGSVARGDVRLEALALERLAGEGAHGAHVLERLVRDRAHALQRAPLRLLRGARAAAERRRGERGHEDDERARGREAPREPEEHEDGAGGLEERAQAAVARAVAVLCCVVL